MLTSAPHAGKHSPQKWWLKKINSPARFLITLGLDRWYSRKQQGVVSGKVAVANCDQSCTCVPNLVNFGQ